MAVEAPHVNLFPSQPITNRYFFFHRFLLIDFFCNDFFPYVFFEFWCRSFPNTNNGNYHTLIQSDYPLAGAIAETFLPMYQSSFCDAKAPVKADSGLTYNIPVPRKRSRDWMSNQQSVFDVSSLFCEELSLQMQQQQLEIDRLIAENVRNLTGFKIFIYLFISFLNDQTEIFEFRKWNWIGLNLLQTEKVRLEVQERRKRQSRMLVNAIHQGIGKKLKEKDEEIQRIGKLNWLLQERVRTLSVENQIWRELAQTNEATANSLRTNLEQVLAHVTEERQCGGGGGGEGGAAEEEAESCCGSNGEERGECGGERGNEGEKSEKRKCRKCGVGESCVLLLPCRHLCICTACGSTTLTTCPVCNSVINASIHVNMS